jgi:hypothetical protein
MTHSLPKIRRYYLHTSNSLNVVNLTKQQTPRQVPATRVNAIQESQSQSQSQSQSYFTTGGLPPISSS